MEVDWEDLTDAVQTYLDSKNVVLWADFDLTKKDRKGLAYEWLEQEITNVLALMPNKEEE